MKKVQYSTEKLYLYVTKKILAISFHSLSSLQGLGGDVWKKNRL